MRAAFRKPKYANHITSDIFDLDSVAFLVKDPSLIDPLYIISDRSSPFAEGEKPEAKISIISWKGAYQLRIAIRGDFHVEKPSYYVIDPSYWLEWGWIILPQYEIARLRQFLARFIDEKTGLWELM
ncbi:MAG: hypothetical protein QXV37_01825 [Candidatus Jordarchaeaceae archaeon]